MFGNVTSPELVNRQT